MFSSVRRLAAGLILAVAGAGFAALPAQAQDAAKGAAAPAAAPAA